ncbi:MAG: hypothetical protein ACKVP0_22615 [Pirellulaceae bacterium]
MFENLGCAELAPDGSLVFSMDAELLKQLYAWVRRLQWETDVPVELEHVALAFLMTMKAQTESVDNGDIATMPKEGVYEDVKRNLPRAMYLMEKHGSQGPSSDAD